MRGVTRSKREKLCSRSRVLYLKYEFSMQRTELDGDER